MTDCLNFARRHRGVNQLAAVAALLASGLLGATSAQAQQGMTFVKTGPAFALDQGFFKSSDTGWSIAGGVRQPLAGRGPDGFVFLDLGGSFLTIAGNAELRPTPGTYVVIGPAGPVSATPLSDLLNAQLVELNRASVDAAMGWQRTPNGPGGGLGMMFRFGGRFGHINGAFREFNSATTDALIAGLAADQTSVLLEDYSNTDTFAGLFFGAGLTLLNTDYYSAAFGPMGVAIGAEVEYSHDWIDFGNYQDSGFSTGAVLFSFELTK